MDFATVVDWREKHSLLKAEFKLNVKVDSARYEIQFGYVTRPTHDHLSQNRVQFEVCNHKWTDLSETRYGVTVLNDSKYGIEVILNLVEIERVAPAVVRTTETNK